MAMDDYDLIVFKVLAYYYALLKRKTKFDRAVLDKLIGKSGIAEEYFTDIIEMMQAEGLISGAVFTKAWGSESILTSDMKSIKITAQGIHYLKENSQMQRVLGMAKQSTGLLSSLVELILL